MVLHNFFSLKETSFYDNISHNVIFFRRVYLKLYESIYNNLIKYLD